MSKVGTDTGRGSPEWSAEDRAAAAWLAALPAVGSALFALALFPSTPALLPLAFVVIALGAYATAFLGVLPFLFAFRKRGWQSLFHYAVAGFAGVFVPWFCVGLLTEYVGSDAARMRVSGMLLLASLIGAVCATAFGWRSRRESRDARSGPV